MIYTPCGVIGVTPQTSTEIQSVVFLILLHCKNFYAKLKSKAVGI